MEPQQRKRFHGAAKGYYKKSMKIAWYDSLVNPLTEVAGIGMILTAIWSVVIWPLNKKRTFSVS